MPNPIVQASEAYNQLMRNHVGTGLDYSHSSDPMYDEYFGANPYVGQTYNKTWFDKLFGGIIRTPYDKWREEMALNAAQYDAGIVDMQQQNLYNSEAAKAQRMRAAGENPDLLGTGDVSDAANTNPDPQDVQLPEAAEPFSAITNFASGFSSIISGAVGMMKTFEDMQYDKIRNDKEIAGLAMDDLFREIPASGFKDEVAFQEWFNAQGNIFVDDTGSEEFYRKSHNIPKRYWDRYKTAYLQARTSLPSELKYYNDAVSRAELRKKFAHLTSSEYYSEDGFDVMRDLIDPLVKLQDKATKLQSELDVFKKENEKRYQSDIVPEELDTRDLELDVLREDLKVQSKEIANRSIQADIAGDSLDVLSEQGYGEEYSLAQIAQVKIGKLIAEAQKEILENLRKSSDEGSRFAKCLEYQMVLSNFYNFNPVNILTGAASGASGQLKQHAGTAAMLAKMFL